MTNEPDAAEEPAAAKTEPAKRSVASRIYAVVLAVLALPIPLALVFVVPAFKKMFEEVGIVLPASTRFILGLSSLFSNYFVLLVPASFVLICGVVALTFVHADLGERKEWQLGLRIALFASLALWVGMILGMLLPLVELIEKL